MYERSPADLRWGGVENDQRETFVFEWQVGHIHLLIWMYLQHAPVALDVTFVAHIAVEHIGSRLIEVELAAATAWVEN